MLRQVITCHWTARRIHRYLDADPAAPLTPSEISRLEEHVATCERCSEVLRQHRLLSRALAGWSGHHVVDRASTDRLRSVLDDLVEGRLP
ncbi:zf-HC2 domain-containing protein [Aeromicrobium sp. Sec7.5]|uniref:zf-HC2 domain-containing protein n=1 Tax=Aeromicrobium sp. Sec7.5 TaxID=3121276 RepID=UPI002FE4B11A